jgi:hypothetical protein
LDHSQNVGTVGERKKRKKWLGQSIQRAVPVQLFSCRLIGSFSNVGAVEREKKGKKWLGRSIQRGVPVQQ